ncbi:helix-turn-helix domain-containing protein [Acetobacter cerevisiae]|nr:helix-turn-helix domain-containing protein [Acetobacter cerevisiae]
MELKDLIRAARKEKKLSQAALAELIGVNKSAVAQWEAGYTNPSNDSMDALRSVLSFSEQIAPIGSAPYAGELVDDPDELALIRFWRSLTDEKRRVVIDLLHIGRPIRP